VPVQCCKAYGQRTPIYKRKIHGLPLCCLYDKAEIGISFHHILREAETIAKESKFLIHGHGCGEKVFILIRQLTNTMSVIPASQRQMNIRLYRMARNASAWIWRAGSLPSYTLTMKNTSDSRHPLDCARDQAHNRSPVCLKKSNLPNKSIECCASLFQTSNREGVAKSPHFIGHTCAPNELPRRSSYRNHSVSKFGSFLL
jgi:hypothetical protein